MKVSIPNPSEKTLLEFLQKQSAAHYSYHEIGSTATTFPVGYDHDSNRVLVGQGIDDFHLAKASLAAWKMFPSDWVRIFPHQPPIEAGREVAVLFQLFGLWWYNSCRIVYTIDQAHQFGFAYGTLHGHVERGEECFQVYLDKKERVWYQIEAFSQPNIWLTKIAYPIARRFQRRFVRDSFKSMKDAVRKAQ